MTDFPVVYDQQSGTGGFGFLPRYRSADGATDVALTGGPGYDKWFWQPWRGPSGDMLVWVRTALGVHDTDYSATEIRRSTWDGATSVTAEFSVVDRPGAPGTATDPAGCDDFLATPHWSPDGLQVVVARAPAGGAARPTVLDVSTAPATIVGDADFDAGQALTDPSFHPDPDVGGAGIGRLIYCRAGSLHRRGWDGTAPVGARTLIFDATGWDPEAGTNGRVWLYDPAYSPSGADIAALCDFNGWPAGTAPGVQDWGVMACTAAGASPYRVTPNDYLYSKPEWSPDGAWIYCHRFNVGIEVVRVPSDGSAVATPGLVEVLVTGGLSEFPVPYVVTPLAPLFLVVLVGTIYGSVDLSWTAAGDPGIVGYEYRKSPDGSSWGPWIAVPGGVVTSWTDLACGPAVLCCFQVRAVSGTGLRSGPSNTDCNTGDDDPTHIPPPPSFIPPPPSLTTLHVGCDTGIVIRRRGVRGPIFESGILDAYGRGGKVGSVRWGWSLDAVSQARMFVPIEGLADAACCRALSDVRPVSDTLHVFRGDDEIWVGPITGRTEERGGVTVEARDFAQWLWWRRIHQDHHHKAVDVATIAAHYAIDALSPDPPDVAVWATDVGITDTRDVLATSYRNCGAAVEEIARNGLDWRCIAHRLDFGGVLGTSPVATLRDSDFGGPITIALDGLAYVSDVAVRGEGEVVGRAGVGVSPTYGLVEREWDEHEINDVGAANASAARRYAARGADGVPVVVTLPSTLDPRAALDLADLAPGNLFTVEAKPSCTAVSLPLRLVAMTVDVGIGSNESVQPTFEPVGGTDSVGS